MSEWQAAPSDDNSHAVTIAEEICSGAPPAKLVMACQFLLHQARTTRAASSGASSRKDVRDLLKSLAANVRAAEAALKDESLTPFFGFLTGWRPTATIEHRARNPALLPGRLSALGDNAELLLQSVREGPGSDNLHDVMGGPRGELVAAVGVVRLIEIVKGKRPSKSNPSALRAWELIWTPNAEPGEAASRHIASALKGMPKHPGDSIGDPILGAWMMVSECILRARLWDAYPDKKPD